MIRRPPRSTLLPYTTPVRSAAGGRPLHRGRGGGRGGPGRARRDRRPVLVPALGGRAADLSRRRAAARGGGRALRSEEHTSEFQSRQYLVCRILHVKKSKYHI